MNSTCRNIALASVTFLVLLGSATSPLAQDWRRGLGGGYSRDEECSRRVRHWEYALRRTLEEGGPGAWSSARMYRSELDRARADCCRYSRRWSWCDSYGRVRPDAWRYDPNDPDRDRDYRDLYRDRHDDRYRDHHGLPGTGLEDHPH